MAQLPEPQNTTAAKVIQWYASKPQEHRPHMGASMIGHGCDRYIWLAWHWALSPKFDGRMLRLFNTGQRAENRFVEELRAIGAEVWDTDASGKQWSVSAFNGHFAGSLDGVAKGLPEAPKTPAVLEFKTHNDKSFKELAKKGVAEAKPQHYSQMQIYMGLMELERALYLAENKNTSEIYSEWIHFDDEVFANLMARAERLIESTQPPARIGNADHFECKYCSMNPVCHGGQSAEVNCRTCCHASPIENAEWHCSVHKMTLSTEMQRQPCNSHLLIPGLIPYAEVHDGGDGWAAYQIKGTDLFFCNGPAAPGYGPSFTSKELFMTDGSLMANIIATKTEFPGSKVVEGSSTYAGSGFEDMKNDLLDEPVRESPQEAKKRKRVEKSVRDLEALK